MLASALMASSGPEHNQFRDATPAPPQELEPFPRRKILLTGATGGLGEGLAKKFALEGYTVVAGTRSEENFLHLKESIRQIGGSTPLPFIADLTKPEEVTSAYQALQLGGGEKLHFMPVAAGGLEAVRLGIGKQIVKLKRVDTNEIPVVDLTKINDLITAKTFEKSKVFYFFILR